MEETASARQSRLHAERRAEELKPTLIGQLKLIREAWGEGFDEDVAQPLAVILDRLRKQMEAAAHDHEEAAYALENKIMELEAEGEENATAAEELHRLRDDLEDVPRGVRTLEEILATYAPVP